jgi:hypothetical protein
MHKVLNLLSCRRPKGYWEKIENQRRFCEYIAKKKNHDSWKDWNKVKLKDIIREGGSRIMSKYNQNVLEMLKVVYPEYPWSLEDREIHPQNYWSSLHHQKQFFDMISTKLQFEKLDDFYTLSAPMIHRMGGGGLLNRYNGSVFSALKVVYPEHDWDSTKWNFKKWNMIKQDLRSVLLYLIKYFQIRQQGDWYRISNVQLNQMAFCGSSIINHGGIRSILRKIYPDLSWEQKRFTLRTKKSDQRLIYVYSSLMFPNYLVVENYSHPLLIFSSGNPFVIISISIFF